MIHLLKKVNRKQRLRTDCPKTPLSLVQDFTTACLALSILPAPGNNENTKLLP